jgi:hypothetical protein
VPSDVPKNVIRFKQCFYDKGQTIPSFGTSIIQFTVKLKNTREKYTVSHSSAFDKGWLFVLHYIHIASKYNYCHSNKNKSYSILIFQKFIQIKK